MGSYANASDYVRDLIRHDQEEHKDRIDEDAIAAIRQGIADLRAGRVTPAEELFRQLEEKYRAR
jgi:antitoxin ParD1/3/4